MERGSRAAGSGEEVEGADEEGGRLTEGGRGESREDSGYPSTEMTVMAAPSLRFGP